MSPPIMRVVLASSSPIRQKILNNAGVDFQVRKGAVDEEIIKKEYLAKGESPEKLACALALAKANSVECGPNDVIIGADQVLVLDGVVLNKPNDMTELKMRLEALRGRSHQLVGALACLTSDGSPYIRVSQSLMSVRDFSDQWLDAYLEHEQDRVLYCVGGYKYEGLGVQMFDHVKGDYYAILGLDLLPLMHHLREIGALQS